MTIKQACAFNRLHNYYTSIDALYYVYSYCTHTQKVFSLITYKLKCLQRFFDTKINCHHLSLSIIDGPPRHFSAQKTPWITGFTLYIVTSRYNTNIKTIEMLLNWIVLFHINFFVVITTQTIPLSYGHEKSSQTRNIHIYYHQFIMLVSLANIGSCCHVSYSFCREIHNKNKNKNLHISEIMIDTIS